MSDHIIQELDKVIAGDHHDPFQVLGLHPLADEPGKAVIRTVLPLAESVRLVTKSAERDMYKMRDEGLYELVISDYREPYTYYFEATCFNQEIRYFHDPYRLEPQLSDYDLHLFNAGNHYQIYNKLGAHPLIIDGIEGTIFRVWAPGARRVSVIADFNYWDGRVHQMRALAQSGIWELFIPGIKHGEIYKYEIRTQDNNTIEKSDPFQFYGEIRPKSASIVWDMDGYKWHDDKWLQGRKGHISHDGPMSIYEVHLGSWQRDPSNPDRFLSYREIAGSLVPHVKKMGFTHIEILPITEHPLDESWGYQTTGYFSVTSRFGTPQDFMYLVDCCHQEGIGVIMDWVPSHFPADGHSLAMFDGTPLYEHADPQQGFHPEWQTMIFNYGRKEVANFLIASAMFWMEKFHIDGLRVDAVASMLYLDYARQDNQWQPNPHGGRENLEAIEFLKHLNAIIYSHFPDVDIIAEESTSFFGVSKATDQGGLGFGYKWNMGWMNDTLDYFSRDPVYRKFHHNNLTFSLFYAFSENFVLPLSHDEVVHGKKSLLSKMPGDHRQQFANIRLLFLYLWTHPGKKLLFMGGEFGQISEWYSKVSLDWHLAEHSPAHQQCQLFVEKLNKLYKKLPSLWQRDCFADGFAWMDYNDVDNNIICYARFAADRDDHVVCLLNMSPEIQHNYKMGVPGNEYYQEIFNSDRDEFGGTDVTSPEPIKAIEEGVGEAPCHVSITIPPLSGVILQPTR